MAHRALSLIQRLTVAAVTAVGSLTLTACSNMSGVGGSSEFRCKAPDGIPCTSISGVHYNERAGNLPSQRMLATGEAGLSAGVATAVSTNLTSGAGNAPVNIGNAPSPAPLRSYNGPAAARGAANNAGLPPDNAPYPALGAIRSDPTVIRIWIAPWEDADGDLHEESRVYLQIDSGRWLIEHNRERIRREFAPTVTSSAPASRGAGSSAASDAPGASGAQTPAKVNAGSGQSAIPTLKPVANGPLKGAVMPGGVSQ